MKLKNKITVSISVISFLFLNSFKGQLASAESNYTQGYNELLWLTTIGSILVAILVFSLLVIFVVKYNEKKSVSRKHIENENKFEAGWILLAIALSVILIIASTAVLVNIQTPPEDLTENAIELKVQAYTFHWEIKDANNNFINWTTDNISTPHWYSSVNHELPLSVNQNYMLNLSSNNVIHSFFAYGLNFKLDVVPGQYNIMYFKISEPGRYIVTCAEYCGANHFNMKFTIVAS